MTETGRANASSCGLCIVLPISTVHSYHIYVACVLLSGESSPEVPSLSTDHDSKLTLTMSACLQAKYFSICMYAPHLDWLLLRVYASQLDCCYLRLCPCMWYRRCTRTTSASRYKRAPAKFRLVDFLGPRTLFCSMTLLTPANQETKL